MKQHQDMKQGSADRDLTGSKKNLSGGDIGRNSMGSPGNSSSHSRSAGSKSDYGSSESGSSGRKNSRSSSDSSHG